MPLGADDVEAARTPATPGPEFDVGAAARHVGGDVTRARLARRAATISASCMVKFRVQHVVRNFFALEHAAEQLARLDADGADQHRLLLARARP